MNSFFIDDKLHVAAAPLHVEHRYEILNRFYIWKKFVGEIIFECQSCYDRRHNSADYVVENSKIS